LQKTFATNVFLITLDKLHAILVAIVNEDNGQQNASPFVYSCMPFYITIKIDNLQNHTWQMKKVWKIYVLKIYGGSSLFIFNGFRL